ncbi:16S rRNA (cytosine(967)-C(5))-methyltransferase RsmB [Neiella marina]|uniref:16S rRNA (cytosine(967)-C(5))-methyltransferase n=1 Tax=Neiella holothuriorum TaxID=2870530 RepID=A0ABS7EMH2_9GAMM|nr:16S rRNA (cytosine(967)-C(5))-methyltransferase RsmB [Neiella holothuriorum]MBW8192776.1 16S rRNA (cytosine(967)-C(5))-methyltransferase RsmB [Neiella holothuriorum]
MNARACAAQAIYWVLEQGRSLTDALQSAQAKLDNPKDKGLVAELSYGALRWLPQLDTLAQPCIAKPLKGRYRVIHHLILVGIYQIKHTRIPEHAAVSETVAASRQLNGKAFSGMINAVLRTVIRQDDNNAWPAPTVEYAHPNWLIKALQADYPEQWQQVLNANNERAPMWLRVNQRQQTTTSFQQALANAEIEATATESGPDALLLTQPTDVTRLPGYDEGWFAVQDLAAQQAAHLLPKGSGLKVLDVCAAPGGKTCHWLEANDNQLAMTAIDIDASRLQRVSDNLQRLQLNANVVTADASSADWWDGELFDAILLDAPCSATGVIRRHPDIKWLRTKQDIAALAELQAQIIRNVWSMLKPNGTLVYATCSVLKVENQLQISDFLTSHTDAKLIPIQPHETPDAPGWQILPGQQQMDGFYYARLQKMDTP